MFVETYSYCMQTLRARGAQQDSYLLAPRMDIYALHSQRWNDVSTFVVTSIMDYRYVYSFP